MQPFVSFKGAVILMHHA